MILAFLAFTALLGTALLTIGETLVTHRDKILAALAGRSLLTEPMVVTRPVTVRTVSRRVSRPLKAAPRLRAAA